MDRIVVNGVWPLSSPSFMKKVMLAGPLVTSWIAIDETLRGGALAVAKSNLVVSKAVWIIALTDEEVLVNCWPGDLQELVPRSPADA